MFPSMSKETILLVLWTTRSATWRLRILPLSRRSSSLVRDLLNRDALRWQARSLVRCKYVEAVMKESLVI
jgi:hypothetical protein